MKNEVHFPYNVITPLTLPLPGGLTTTLASLKEDVKNTTELEKHHKNITSKYRMYFEKEII